MKFSHQPSVVAALLVIGSLVSAQGVGGGQAAQPTTMKLSEHVYVIPQGGSGARSNVGLIVGTRASLVVDSGLGPSDGKRILAELGKVSTAPTTYLTATHFHPEHILGQSGFPASAIVIRSRAMQQDITEKGTEMFSMFNQMPNNA